MYDFGVAAGDIMFKSDFVKIGQLVQKSEADMPTDRVIS
jgi:hypothetical protein